MNIVVKAVKCGDSSLINGPHQHLLIDCGSDNSDPNNGMNSSQFATSSIQPELNSNLITDLVITHFHKDHFNGILNIDNNYRFKTVYLPYSIINGRVLYSGAISRLLAVASPRSFGFNLANNTIKLFQKLEHVSNNICCKKAGEYIPFDGINLRVLWPKIEYPFGTLPVEVGHIRKGTDGTFRFESDQKPNITLASVENYFNEEFSMIVGEDSEFIEIIKRFQNDFEQYITNLHNNEPDGTQRDFSFSRVAGDSYTDMNVARERFLSNINPSAGERINKFARGQYHSLVTGMNAISMILDYEDKFAYLGDAPSTIIDYLHNSFAPFYKCVKLQHHATNAYYTNNTPRGKYWIVSNGGYTR